MSLEIQDSTQIEQVEKFEVTERLYVDVEGKIVPEDSPDAAFLYATPGKRVPLEEAIEKGLTKPAKKASTKKAEPADNKQADTAKNK